MQGGSCNRTTCQAEHQAHCFNPHTNAYYCQQCANDINVWLRKDGLTLIDIPENYRELVQKTRLDNKP